MTDFIIHWFEDPIFVKVVCWYHNSVFLHSEVVQNFRCGFKFPISGWIYEDFKGF